MQTGVQLHLLAPHRPPATPRCPHTKHPKVPPASCRMRSAASTAWVLCPHQHAQQHLVRLEQRETILPWVALHPRAKRLLAVINCKGAAATTSKSKAPDFAPHHPGHATDSRMQRQEAAEPFKPDTGSLTETEPRSNINLQHPGLSTSDKR